MIAPDIIRLSPNINDPPMPAGVRTVIIHCTRSGTSMNPTEFNGTLNYMAKAGTTSSHWVASRRGLKARVVWDDRQAWHASEDNDNAWGIELEQGVEDDGFTPELLQACVAICRGYVQDFGVPPVRAANSKAGGFIGHQDTAQGRRDGKSDPGHLFPWDWFIEQLQPQPVYVVGIGAHYVDGSSEEIWAPRVDKALDGVGVRYSDGRIERLWPPE